MCTHAYISKRILLIKRNFKDNEPHNQLGDFEARIIIIQSYHEQIKNFYRAKRKT
jgi:two-component sensor histidine kinase